MDKQFFKDKTVLVMGLGRFGGGLDCARFVHSAGAKVIITDLATKKELARSLDQINEIKDIEYRLGCHEIEDFENADIIIVNPAVKPDNKFIKHAISKNKVVTSQIAIFFQLCPALKIGITGANGKSTTTKLTHHLLQNAIGQKNFDFKNVWLGGNIGNLPLLDIVEEITPRDVVVLEISSFQLEQLDQIKEAPHISLITNIAPNHLDRHGSFESYCQAKEIIFKNQYLNENDPAVSIFNAHDEITSSWYEKYKTDQGRKCLAFCVEDVDQKFGKLLPLPGRANLENLAAAVTIATHLGVDENTIKKALPHFEPLPHRLQLIAEKNNVKWYNDSIATTPESTIAALEAFDQPKVLIAGGYDKALPFNKLAKKISQTAKVVILLGQTADKIAAQIESVSNPKIKVEKVFTLEDAVKLAKKLADPGDVVLLSPACASYDMFENFEQRGNIFAELVNKLR